MCNSCCVPHTYTITANQRGQVGINNNSEMEKIERNYHGWDMVVTGKRFNDRFWVSCTPNMNYIYQLIQNEIYVHLATEYAEQNNLSYEYQHEREIVEEWTDNAIQQFIEDLSTMSVKFHIDSPLTLFCSLEERLNVAMDYVKKKDCIEGTPISYYKVLQNDERFNYRIKI